MIKSFTVALIIACLQSASGISIEPKARKGNSPKDDVDVGEATSSNVVVSVN
jgi:hypothetical protein